MHQNSLDILAKAKAFILDIDGVLTDGTLFVLQDGLMARRMNIKDGYALQLAVKNGYEVIIISGGNSPEVKHRLEKLGVAEVHMQVEDKKAFLQQLIHQKNIPLEDVIFMGDDMPDLEVMRSVGIPCCPADAVQEIKAISIYISPFKGGEGCVRDVIEKVLKLQQQWPVQNIQIKAQ